MKLSISAVLLAVSMSWCSAVSAESPPKSLLPETLPADRALLVQCFSYSTPNSINLPMGTLTVAGLMPGNPNLTVTFTQLLGNPITGTLNGTGKRNKTGVTGRVSGYLSQFGGPKKWITSDVTAVYPTGTTSGTLNLSGLGQNMTLVNGCQN